jgi:hypothetical protein
MKFLFIPLVATILVACQSSQKNTHWLELEEAALALRLVYDQSLAAEPQDVLSCEVSGEEALSYMMPLKAQIDVEIEKERKLYENDPKGYAALYKFENCELTCQCAGFARVLEFAVVKSEHKEMLASHLGELNRKAMLQPVAELKACAQKSKLCGSDLLAKLKKP